MAAHGWATMKTAPRDGTSILVRNWDGKIYQAAWSPLSIMREGGNFWSETCASILSPTLWAPMPDF